MEKKTQRKKKKSVKDKPTYFPRVVSSRYDQQHFLVQTKWYTKQGHHHQDVFISVYFLWRIYFVDSGEKHMNQKETLA